MLINTTIYATRILYNSIIVDDSTSITISSLALIISAVIVVSIGSVCISISMNITLFN